MVSSEYRPGAGGRRKLSKEREAEIEQERLKQLANIPPRAKGSPNVRKVFLEEVDAPYDSGAPPEEEQDASLSEPEPPAMVSPEEDEGDTKLVRRKHRRRKPRDAEKGWGRYHGTLWWVLAGIFCIGGMGALVRSHLAPPPDQQPLPVPDRPAPLSGIEGTPIESLVSQSSDLLPVVRELTAQSQEPEGEDLAAIYRNGETTLGNMGDWSQRIANLPAFDLSVNHELHASVVGETPFLFLRGMRVDHTPGTIFFLREDNRYVMDWEATVGFSELLPGEAAKLPDREPRLMRAVLAEAVFYQSGGYTENDFLCVTLHHRDRNEYLWAYAPVGSHAEQIITNYLEEKSAGVTERPVTLKVRKGRSTAHPSQVEIVEFHHWGWVAPQEGEEDDVDGTSP